MLSVEGQGWVRETHSKHRRLTFTWILIGRGMPSFSSLVFSLKSLQNCPIGIPLWMGKQGNKHGKMMEDRFKMYEKCELANIQTSLVSHCAARIQMPVLSVNQNTSERSDYICTHEWLREKACRRICDECECSCAVTF